MTAEDYLRQIKYKRTAIDQAYADMENLKKLLRMADSLDEKSRSAVRRKLKRESKRLGAVISDALMFEETVRQQLAGLSTPRDHQKPRFARMLIGIYMHNKSLPEMADEMYYTEHYASRIHRSALEAFARQYGFDTEYRVYMGRDFGFKPRKEVKG